MTDSISIIIPVYNSANYLEKCIQSVVSQTYENWELLLVDDGSTDESLSICKRYSLLDNRITVINQNNSGPAAAVKNGISRAKGNYLMFLDSDDWVEKDYCIKLLNVACDQNCEIVVCGYLLNTEDGNETKKSGFSIDPGKYTRQDIEDKIFPKILSTGRAGFYCIQPSRCAKIFKKELLISNFDLLKTNYKHGEDFLLIFSALFLCNNLYLLSDCYPYHYRVRKESVSRSYDKFFYRDLMEGIQAQKEIVHYYDKDLFFSQQIEQRKLDVLYTSILYTINNRKIIGIKEAKDHICQMVQDYQMDKTVKYGAASLHEIIIKHLIIHGHATLIWCISRIWSLLKGR